MFDLRATDHALADTARHDGAADPWPLIVSVSAISAAAGLVAMYFLDPDRGRGRRAQAVDRIAGSVRRTVRRTERAGRHLASEAYGVAQQVRHLGPDEAPPTDDASLKAKVETELFRDRTVDKGRLNINVENGVTVLRGVAPTPQAIDEIEARVRAIDGVAEVHNLLHLPDTPAPEWRELASTRS